MKKLLSGVKRVLSSGPSSRGFGSCSDDNGSQDSPQSSSFLPSPHGTVGSSHYLAHDDVPVATDGDDISIKCTSMVTQIAMNIACPEMANLAYIEGEVPILGLDHFFLVHILCEEPEHCLSLLYGRMAIWLWNPGLRLYSSESLTLQFDQMGEVCHSFVGPPCTHGRARMEAA
jgi:hypothetical protein